MRVLIASMLAAIAALALGCQESGFDERKETARPLKVQHVKGESKVPGQAERVATLSIDALDDVLALGVRPVRAALPGLEPPRYLRGPAGGVEPMNPIAEEDLAALDAAQPDLIVGRLPRGLYDELSLVAPTVITAVGGSQWKLNLRQVGEALGRTNDAERLLIDYDRRVAGLRRGIEGRPSVAVATLADGRFRFAPRDSFAGTILADAGLRQVRTTEAADLVMLGTSPGVRLDGSFETVDKALWWGPGGAHASRAALADLQRILR